MASGREHALATLSAATCFTVNAVTTGSPWEYVIGAFEGLLLSPDLDVDNGNVSYYLIDIFPRRGAKRKSFVRRLGKAVSSLWAWYWKPYAKLMPHRSWWSHAPVFSTLIRWFYFHWPLYVIGHAPPLDMLVGLIAVDVIHWMMDFEIFSKVWRLT